MARTSNLHTDFCELTRPFEGEATNATTTGTPCEIFQFASFQLIESAPARTRSVSDVAASWDQKGRTEMLQRARRRLRSKMPDGSSESIRSLRLDAGLSQTHLAKLLGTSQAHVARLEAGTSQPTLDTCRRLAQVFSVDLNRIGQAFCVSKEA